MRRVLPGSGAKEPPRPTLKSPKVPGSKNQGQGPRRGGGGRAQQLANAQIRAGVNDARKERRVIRREADADRRRANRDYKRSLGDLNYIFGETGDYMAKMGQDIQSNYAAQTTRAESAQAALVQQLTNNATQVGGGLSAELSRLGLSGVDQSDFAADAGNAVNLAQQTGANNLANINAQASGAADISALLQGMNAGSKASSYGDARNALEDNLYDIYQNKRDGYNQVREAISDLRGTRKDLTAQMLQQLGGGHWGRYLRKKKSGGGSSQGGQSSYGSASNYNGGSGGGGNQSFSPAGGGNDINSLLLGGITRRRR